MSLKSMQGNEHDIYQFIEYMHRFSDVIIKLNKSDGKILYLSPSIHYLLGYNPSDLIGKSLGEFVHPDDSHFVKQHVIQSGHIQKKITYRIRKASGEYIWVESSFGDVENEPSDTSICLTRDITERKLAEDKLQESQRIYKNLVEHSNDTIGILTYGGHWVFMNNSGTKLFGVTNAGEMVGASMLDFMNAPYSDRLIKALQQVKSGYSIIELHDMQITRSDRGLRDVDVRLIATKYKGRDTVQIVLRDISERKQAEEMLQQTEKLTVAGQLAAGIAHEIRNPLTAIKGFAQMLNLESDNNYASVILQELDHIDEIVNDLLILAKPQVEQTEMVDLGELIERTIHLLNTEAILHNIVIKFDWNKNRAYTIESAADKLKQVFINLIKNSIESMEKGGKIVITLEKEDDGYKISFTDEGSGIPPERMEKIGEPFYSTKERGTGLGLMICNKIIKNHHGSMDIRSQLDEGTCVTIRLPENMT